jgi:peptidyl-prolyl cis-trans isomerase C
MNLSRCSFTESVLGMWPKRHSLTSRASISALCGVLMVAGCGQPKPKGQVIAIVNGEEVTVSELNEEAKARGVAIANDRRLRDTLVRDLLDRKLLVQEAMDRKLHKTPEHLLAARRMTEILLAQQLLGASTDEAQPPDARQLQQFINANPQAFGERVLMSVDLVAFPPVADARLTRALAGAKSVRDVQGILSGAKVIGRRGVEVWDSANLDRNLAQRLLGMTPDQIVIVPGSDRFVAARVVSTAPQPVREAERLAVARELLRRKRAEAIMQQILQRARAEAEVEYQGEFAPGAPGAWSGSAR